MTPLGPFDLDVLVARGGMGEVWRGRHREQGVPVAIKRLPEAAGADPATIALFHDEARAAASLDHPSIVLLFDYGIADGRPWIAMEYAGGGTLGEAMRAGEWPELRRALGAVLDGLAHAHARGIVHRDVKAGNVLRTEAGGYKLADFGIAHVVGRGAPGGARSGTPSVMAPEQFEGRWRDFGPWTDLYALGAVTWTLVTGRKPFPGRSWQEQAEGHLRRPLPPFRPRFTVPDDLEAWLARLLAKDPADRYRCAADAAFALGAFGPAARGRADAERPEADPGAVTLVWEGTESTGTRSGWGDGASYRRDVAPMPGRWAPPEGARRAPAIVGAGLGLWGLRTLRLVGRTAERDLLWARLAEVRRTGRPGVVAVRGASGAGKSRLVRWMCERARELGSATVLEVSHDRAGGPSSGLPAMLRRHLALGELTAEGRLARVGALLARLGGDDGWLAEALARLAAPDEADPGRVRERSAAVERLLALLARERPVVLVLDDAQWGLDALAFAAFLLRSAEPAPILVVVAVMEEGLAERPEERALVDRLLAGPATAAVTVGPLPPADRRELLTTVLGLSAPLARRVDERTAGNPLFAIQLVGDWVQRGLLVPGRDGFRVARGARLELPESLREVWDDRLDRLLAGRPADQALALEVAAVLGREVDAAEWGAACGSLGIVPPSELVEALLARRLATAERPDERWAFVHGMLREAVELRVPAERAPELHRACAAAVRGDEARRGRHLVRAGLAEAAARPLLDGAWLAAVAASHAEAADLVAEARAALAEAGLPGSDPRWGRARFVVATSALQRSRLEIAEEEAAALLEESERHGWSLGLGWGLLVRGRLHLVRWRLRDATADLSRSAALTREHGDGPACETALRGLAIASMYAGDLATAERWITEARATLGPRPSELALATFHLLEGTWLDASRRGGEALAALERAVVHFRRAGEPIGLASALATLAYLLREGGRLDESEERFAESQSLARAHGSDLEHLVRSARALCTFARGDAAGAVAALREECAWFEAHGSPGHRARVEMYLASVLARLGDGEAEARFERGRAEFARSPAVQVDVVREVERVADAARTRGWDALAGAASALAEELWGRLGHRGDGEHAR